MSKPIRRVVMFGAGASYGARGRDKPPLGDTLHDYVRRYLENQRACDEAGEGLEDKDVDWTVIKKSRNELKRWLCGARSFERLVTDLLDRGDDGRKLLLKLNLLMAYALTPPINDDPKVDDAFLEGPDIYDEFLKSRFPSLDFLQNVSFITLNYDCLFERAICRSYFSDEPLDGEGRCLCRHVDYWSEKVGVGIEVLKPHGSINWVPDDPDDYKPLPPDGEIPCIGTLGADGVWEFAKIKTVSSPIGEPYDYIIAAHYGPGKYAQANPRTLAGIRKNALMRIGEAEQIEIIGVHLPDWSGDDPFLDEALKIMRDKERYGVHYVNPKEEEIKRARELGFTPIKKCFAEYVKTLKV